METAKEKTKIHYAWIIMAVLIFMKLGTGGATAVCMANFVTPIVQELECQVSELTMFVSVQAISMALLYTTAAKVITTKKIGSVLGIASLVEAGGMLLMSTYHHVYLFVISGAIIGIAQAFTGFVTVPIIINMWFRKKTGTVLGIITAVGSGASMVYTVLSAQLITSFGWRNAYRILGFMGLLITVPIVFIFMKTPQEAGCSPYGEEGEQKISERKSSPVDDADTQWGFTLKQAFKQPFVYMAWFACVCYSYGCGVSGYTTSFMTMELGRSVNFGGRMALFSSAGGIISSLVLGQLNDRFGILVGHIWGTVTTATGYGCLILSVKYPALLAPGLFAVGLGNSMYQVQCPLLARSIVGSAHYSEIWSAMMMVNSLVGGGLYASIGLFYDKLGSYYGAFVMAIGLYTTAMAAAFLALYMKKRSLTPAGSR